jgi:PAS domain S-box-containing protein
MLNLAIHHPDAVSKDKWRTNKSRRDLVILILAVALSFLFFVWIDFHDRFYEYTRVVERYELDELIYAVLLAALGLVWFSRRRWKDLTAEMAERRRAEEQLSQAHQILSFHMQNSPLAVIEWDPESRIRRWSPQAERIFGWKEEELRDREFDMRDFVHPDDANRVSAVVARLQSGADPQNRVYNRNYAKDGGLRHCEWYNSAFRDESGRLLSILSLVRDITEQKEADQKLRSSREQLRALSAHLQSVREEERIRIAREIHDNMGHALTGLKIDLGWLGRRLPASDPLLVRKLRSLSELADSLIELAQRITAELRPGVLDDFGLVAAIEWQAREFQIRTGVNCTFESEREEVTLSQDRMTAVFRICQEILTNVARHAGAANVHIALKEEAGRLLLRVRDDGRGIREEEIASSRAFGLIGMRERAILFEGDIAITGAPGDGTTVEVRLPLTGVEAVGASI